MSKQFKGQITLALTGASGAAYGVALLSRLVQFGYQVHFLMSEAAKVVVATELQQTWPQQPHELAKYLSEQTQAVPEQIKVYSGLDWFSPVASGSGAPKTMVICPCSGGTLASICHGLSDNLVERAADVILKERGRLILVPRETPFSTLHLQNMLSLSQMGVTIMPAAPGFYHHPQSIDDLIDFMVARILDHLNIDNEVSQRWGHE
ncbi:flavin prenyltransferase UbiX [Motilimonas pumila]|uniref:Flavin prenyltransferase UbiX n=1 Tax=Motilimonas pumila TaxID=2303987 RepID=A0A418YC55_9GAMM|nr:flavin prenyltransferase UbiX [Motilimonas pumila]RJG42064.1 UbiX family flavin prenyltransferase [Motilimonas pumila]